MLADLLDLFNVVMLLLSYVIIDLFIKAMCEKQKRQDFLLQPPFP